MKSIVSILILFLATGVLNLRVYAARECFEFTYTGYARDCSCQILANQQISLSVRLITSSTVGTVHYVESHTVTTDGYGMYSIEVGSGTFVSGIPPSGYGQAAWDNVTWFIGITIDNSNEIFQLLETVGVTSTTICDIKVGMSCDCNTGLAATVRYFENGARMQMCDGAGWINVCCFDDCNYVPVYEAGLLSITQKDEPVTNTNICTYWTDQYTLVLSDYDGEIVQWESNLNNAQDLNNELIWTPITNTSGKYFFSQPAVGFWQYRVEVLACDETLHSNIISFTSVDNNGTPIVSGTQNVCIGEQISLSIQGNYFEIYKWQKEVQGSNTWTEIANSASTNLLEIADQPGIWVYWAVSYCCNEPPEGYPDDDPNKGQVPCGYEIVVTVSPNPEGGSISYPQTVCQNSPFDLTLTGFAGTIDHWEESYNNGAWTSISNTEATYSEVPTQMGPWRYRALVTSVCNSGTVEDYSDIAYVTVYDLFDAGSVSGSKTIPLCSSTGTLTLTGYIGSIIKWQKRKNNGTWIDIANTSSTYSETPQTSGTWEYSSMITNNYCIGMSSPATVIVSSPCNNITEINYSNMTYHTVEICTQCWLKENLNVGTMISCGTDQTNNAGGNVIEKYCYDNKADNCNGTNGSPNYGGLYQWAEAVGYANGATNSNGVDPYTSGFVRGICPEGWHIPNFNELSQLSNYTHPYCGFQLRKADNNCNNSYCGLTGFDGLLGGYCYDSSIDMNSWGVFWSRTLTNEQQIGHIAYGFSLDPSSDCNITSGLDKEIGFSVRCLKDY